MGKQLIRVRTGTSARHQLNSFRNRRAARTANLTYDAKGRQVGVVKVGLTCDGLATFKAQTENVVSPDAARLREVGLHGTTDLGYHLQKL